MKRSLSKEVEKEKINGLILNGLFPKFIHARYNDGSAVTICQIVPFNDKKGTPIAIGYSLCSVKDVFHRAKGRVIALGRAETAISEKKSSTERFFKKSYLASSDIADKPKYEYKGTK